MPRSCLAIEIDERPERAWFAADDGYHQRKSERSGAGERLRRAANAKPDRQRILHGSRVDALACKRRAMLAGPVDLLVLANLQEQIELLFKERVVVFELETEQWEGIDE